MRIAQRSERGRQGFTLVELIVVILIILVLMAIIGGGVLNFISMGPKLQTTNDIRQLAVALEAFKLKYKMYPPSRIFLSNNPNDFGASAFGQASQVYLSAIWGRLQWPTGPTAAAQWQAAGIDWSGGKGGIPAGGIILEGDQCLVYFLAGPSVGLAGGVQQVGIGWSTNPQNPTQLTGDRVGPFFEGFTADRLVCIPHAGSAQAQNAFPSFLDAYAIPSQRNVYAFFSSGRSSNNYSADCPSLMSCISGQAVMPYYQLTSGQKRYYNPNTYQIISAGKDFAFGPGGQWPPPAATAAYYAAPTGATAQTGNGFDDLSNFSSDTLGAY
jgi:prepilin-type N-terminal cleavage/methylation domain-containing protein